MTETRVPAGVPTGGQFAASARAEASVVLTVPEPTESLSTVTLPGGRTHTLREPNDPAMTPLVKDLGDGTALVTYIQRHSFESSGDLVEDADEFLREVRNAEAVFSGDDYSANALDEWMQGSDDNLLDRVAFIKNTPDGVEAFGRKGAMDDWDEFKDYAHSFDAAVVLPRHELHQWDVHHRDFVDGCLVRDFSTLANDINEAASSATYSLMHERVRTETGQVIGTLGDYDDGTWFVADDMAAMAESQHLDSDMTLEHMEPADDYDEDDEE